MPKNGKLQFYTMAEGYVKIEEGKPVYVYNYTDHLGNVRLSYADKDGIAQVLQEKNYYPFGLQHKGYNESTDALAQGYKYGYNGKELQNEVDLNWYDYGARNYSPALGRWFVIDPLAEETPQVNSYAYALNNPVYFIDPDGRAAMPPDDYIFNEKGDYVRTDINNKPDRIVIENSTTGKVQGTYNFADPSDAKAIDAGTINKVLFVDINIIGKMLGEAGAFDATNRDNEWSYMNTESKGGGKLDFSYSAIPTEFASDGASADPLTTPSPMLFIPEGDGNAHNHMNFGNFLWGAAGHSLGFSKGTLKAAAHYNSLFNSPTNGYPSQWDSADDQFSIGRGVDLSNRNQFRDRTWSPATGLSAPPKKR